MNDADYRSVITKKAFGYNFNRVRAVYLPDEAFRVSQGLRVAFSLGEGTKLDASEVERGTMLGKHFSNGSVPILVSRVVESSGKLGGVAGSFVPPVDAGHFSSDLDSLEGDVGECQDTVSVLDEHVGVPLEEESAVVAVVVPSVPEEARVLWPGVVLACVVRRHGPVRVPSLPCCLL